MSEQEYAGQASTVPIGALRAADSPRLSGEDREHARRLAELDGALPPILVHRQTMRVIDGMHRVAAARMLGRTTIDVRYFDGDDDSAFVHAVEENVRHGLPLTSADREAAARRIIASFPGWSDRRIAVAAGLAAKTVAAVRNRFGVVEPAARLGRDGRHRPTDAAAGRRLASQLVADQPNASLREIGRQAGISPATVRDVRERMRRGDDPVPARKRANGSENRSAESRHELESRSGRASSVSSVADRLAMLEVLRKDPSLRFTDGGRALLRWLESCSTVVRGWEQMVSAIPSHCLPMVRKLAGGCADDLTRIAEGELDATRSTA